MSAVKTSISCPFKKCIFQIYKKLTFQGMIVNMFCQGTDLFLVGYALELIWSIPKLFAQKCNLFMHQYISPSQYQIPWMPNICLTSTKHTLIYIFFRRRENDIFEFYAFDVFAPLTRKKIKKELYAKIKLLLFALGGHWSKKNNC